MKTNYFWLSYLNKQLQNDEGLKQVNNYINLLDEVKPEDVRIMAGKYLSDDNNIRLVLKPEGSVTQTGQ